MFDLEVELIFVKGTKVDALELKLRIDPRDLKNVQKTGVERMVQK